MPRPLRVLLIEDSESDAGLLLRQLGLAGFEPAFRRVETAAEMESALAAQAWDIVIADYKLPRFDAPSALRLLKKSRLDLPFIVVSGAVGEETAVALMKAGASDYLEKGNLARLGPAVERELDDARRRAEYQRSEQTLHDSEARYRVLFEYSPISLWDEDFSAVRQFLDDLAARGVTNFRAHFASHPEDVRACARLVKVLDINQTTLKLYKAASKAELLGSLDHVIPSDSTNAFMDELVMIAEGRLQFEHESVNRTVTGEPFDVSLNWRVVAGHERDLAKVIISVQDVSQRNQTMRQLAQAEAKLRSLVEQVPAIVYTEMADKPGQLNYISPQIEALSGYTSVEWQSQLWFGNQFIHPDDLPLYLAADAETQRTGEPFQVEYRMRTRDGRTVWVRDESVLIRDENGQPMFWQGVMQDITKRKEAEASLQESQRRLTQLMSNLPGMAFRYRFDPRWSMEYASEGCLPLTGYLPGQLTSSSEPLYAALELPEDHAATQAEMLGALAKKLPYEVTYRIRALDGREKWVWEHGQGGYDASGKLVTIEGFVIDITANKQAETLIQRQLSELEVLYQNSQAINHLMDPHQIAAKVLDLLEDELHWHRAAIRLYNPRTGRVELAAINQRERVSPGLLELEAQLSEAITISGEGLSGWVYRHGQPVRSPRVKEDSRYFETFPGIRSGLYVPLRAGENTIGTISVESELEDAFSERDERLLTTLANQAAVSIQKAQLFVMAQAELAARVQVEAELVQAQAVLEQRVAERTADLKAANLELEKAAHMKDQFLASMSHELRTPLTGILGLSEVLQLQSYGDLSEKQLVALKHISSSGRHLLDLINDILDLSKIEAHQLTVRTGHCRLEQVCEAVMNSFASQCEQKHLQTSLAINPPGLTVRADSKRLKQMIANLIGNAVKFTPEGGSLGIETAISPNGREGLITVWDTGIGIKAEDMPRLFQTFVQLDASLERKYSGTGLGLVLVKRLAELQGGDVGVESVAGAGSRFTIRLPLAG